MEDAAGDGEGAPVSSVSASQNRTMKLTPGVPRLQSGSSLASARFETNFELNFLTAGHAIAATTWTHASRRRASRTSGSPSFSLALPPAAGPQHHPARRTPSPHARRLIYKTRGPDAPTNFPLGAQQRAELDAATLVNLLAGFRAAGERFSSGTSAFRGVCWHKGNGKWLVRIRPPGGGGKRELVGSYEDEVEAACAYDERAVQLHGRSVTGDAREVITATLAGLLHQGASSYRSTRTSAAHTQPVPHLPPSAPAARPSSTFKQRRAQRQFRARRRQQQLRPPRVSAAALMQLV
jgi:hypothetical protein